MNKITLTVDDFNKIAKKVVARLRCYAHTNKERFETSDGSVDLAVNIILIEEGYAQERRDEEIAKLETFLKTKFPDGSTISSTKKVAIAVVEYQEKNEEEENSSTKEKQ